MVLQWWLMWIVMGLIGWPLARKIFWSWEDQGYLMAKIIGIAGISYGTWLLGSLKIVPFGYTTILVVAAIIGGIGIVKRSPEKISWKRIIVEEVIFGILLLGWSFIKGHEPTINGLEKFMDFGFTKSIIDTKFFPPNDMWFAGGTINYYYFGHLMLAVASKLTGLDLGYTFNLMLGTLFALTATMSWSIGRKLLPKSALLIAFLVTLGGNLQTIYAFTSGYAGEASPPPFWTILSKGGWEKYWYPNATRFIPFTIHEFPSYSFVVSDIHGHVMDIPLALLAIGLIVEFFGDEKRKTKLWEVGIFGIVCGLMFMTNALDGPIYLGLFLLLTLIKRSEVFLKTGILIIIFGLTTLPFLATFKSFVSGIGVNCPPAILADTKIGPILFEGIDKCQRSPLWMWLVLWGFFVYAGTALIWQKNKLLVVWSIFCLGLLIFPEFFYFKDIYPQHFRSNTMFKLGYQAFIMMAIVAGYTISKAIENISRWKWWLLGMTPLLFLVMIYPLFSVKSYFGSISIKNYQGLWGLTWLQNKYPDDWAVIQWLEKNKVDGDVILEAAGDSYTDYNKISAFSGTPTVAGWTVHEWLWRGGYSIISARNEDVKKIYENNDKQLLIKYRVKFVIIGEAEKKKYDIPKLITLGRPIFNSGETTIYIVE